jgi:hypothetical protein
MKSEHLTGFAVGLGAAAVGYYFYRKNKTQVDQFLREHGIDMPGDPVVDTEGLTLEQLILEKERLEDIIAEREMKPVETPPEPAPAKKKTTRKKAAKKAGQSK